MGCKKSKLQRKESQEYVNGRKDSWELGQEPQTFYIKDRNLTSNFELNSNTSCIQPDNQIVVNCGKTIGYYSSINVTGSYSNPSAHSTLIGFDVDRSPVSPTSFNYMNIKAGHEEYQGSSIQPHYSAHSMDPPLRQMKSKPLRRCWSVTKVNCNSHYKTMIRYSSLENFQSRNSQICKFNDKLPSDNNLVHCCSEGNDENTLNYSRRKYNSRRLARGLKRNSLDCDSLSSNKSGLVLDINDFSDNGPRVKRRSLESNRCTISPGQSKKDVREENESLTGNCEKEEINSKEFTTMDENVKKLELSETFDILDLLMFPEEWSSCCIDRTGLVDISLQSLEGKSVQKFFNRTSRSKDFELYITEIARIENPFMHSYYLFKKHEMESRNEHVDELYLYHGTKRKNLISILEDNLNWRLYSEKHRFGQGVSFSPLATYSSHYSDKTSDIVMLLCKVLTSNSVIGCPDMQIPPIINEVVYDTSIKDDASVIVKYSDYEFYPLYKLSCTKILRNS